MSDEIKVVIGDSENVSAVISIVDDFSASIDAPVVIACDVYEGDYTFTPDLIGKIFECKDKRMADNIVINPIPSNYGLITYNGFELTVS